MSRAGFDPARRAFIQGAALTEEGRRDGRRRHRPLGPRPPWLPQDVGPEVCAACEAPCVQACAPRIIERHGRDHRLAGAPYLAFERAGCTLCGACAEVCPRTPDAPGAPSLGTADLVRDRCLAWNGVVCVSCLSRCGVRALQRDRCGRVRVEAARCTGCGQCVSACPVEAIRVPGASPESVRM